MADVKWSDSTKFIPQASVGATDNIMGLTSGNVNAKYPGSLFATVAANNTFTGTNTFNSTLSTAFATITGGTIDGTTVGATTKASGAFTTLTATTPVGGASGGTGINNGSSTITVGGNFTMSGAFSSIFRVTASTDLTFPTAGKVWAIDLATQSKTLFGPFVLDNTTSKNVALGNGSLNSISSGIQNTAIGNGALNSTSTANGSVGIGFTAGYGQNGADGIWIGASSGFSSGSGSQNIGIGVNSLFNAGTGGNNIGIGAGAAEGVTTGNSNVTVGQSAGLTISTGSNNTIIGDSSDVSSSAAANRIALGQGITVSTDNTIVLGNTSVTSAKIANTIYPTTTTVNQLLYSSSANTITGLSTANNGALITSAGGVPSISSTLPTAVQQNITNLGTISNTVTFSNTVSFSSPILIQEIQNPVPYNLTLATLSAASGTITSTQIVGGLLLFTPSAAASWTLDTGTNIDSTLSTPNTSRGLQVNCINQSDFTVTINPGTGSTLNGMTTSTQLTIPARTSVSLIMEKTGSATYEFFGPSYMPGNSVISVSGTTRTFALTDANSTQNCSNASAQTLTIDTNANVAFPIGTTINITQQGAGQVSIVGAGGVTLNSPVGSSPKISAQFSSATIVKLATNTWQCDGALTA